MKLGDLLEDSIDGLHRKRIVAVKGDENGAVGRPHTANNFFVDVFALLFVNLADVDVENSADRAMIGGLQLGAPIMTQSNARWRSRRQRRPFEP